MEVEIDRIACIFIPRSQADRIGRICEWPTWRAARTASVAAGTMLPPRDAYTRARTGLAAAVNEWPSEVRTLYCTSQTLLNTPWTL